MSDDETKESRKMYIVVFENYSDFEIKGLYATLEAAKTRMESVNRDKYGVGGHVCVYALDEDKGVSKASAVVSRTVEESHSGGW